MPADALRSAAAAYKLLTIFLGIPNDVTEIVDGRIRFTNGTDPRILAFYKPQVKNA